ncbi:MAG: hypothetical protein ABIP35_10015 [Ginsengibacter sp.]
MIHFSQIVVKPQTIEYWRNPTKEEIKFGYGAIHYREFDFDTCFDKNGYLKQTIKAANDKLKYHR